MTVKVLAQGIQPQQSDAFTLIPSGDYTEGQSSDDIQTPPNVAGLYVVLDVDTAVALQDITLSIAAVIDDLVLNLLEAAAVTLTGQYIYLVYPAADDVLGILTRVSPLPIPPVWRCTVAHSGGGSWNYRVMGQYIYS